MKKAKKSNRKPSKDRSFLKFLMPGRMEYRFNLSDTTQVKEIVIRPTAWNPKQAGTYIRAKHGELK
jgi:hypothetical protein